MGFLDLLLGIAVAMNHSGSKRSQNIVRADDDYEAQFDDGYPDDYLGDGLDGTDDYLGDGLDGDDGDDYADDDGYDDNDGYDYDDDDRE